MQARLTRFLHDRTRMLAAIGHDLRTPITSLKLRAEFIEDEEVRLKMLETLDDLHEMAEATLSFAREEGVQEETRLVDIAALVTSVCEDLADTGKPVSVDEIEPLTIRCRPAAIKRALRNVVENAVAYGSSASVSLARRNGDVEIDIDDQGPGIAPADMERVFHPFVRLESSRSRETGGAGLGLAIARTILRSHGGDLKLKNRSGGGLRATLLLPQASEAGQHEAPADQSALPGAIISTVQKHAFPAQ
jgi:signal transduction histidine kinase